MSKEKDYLKRQVVRRKLDTLNDEFFEGPIKKIIEKLSVYPENAYIEEVANYLDHYDYKNFEHIVCVYELETDEEYEERLAEQEREVAAKLKMEAAMEEQERKEYERLKEKFGK